MDPGSSVYIATGYGLDGPGIESQWGGIFFAPVQTGPGPHSASCKMGTWSFPGVKSGRGVTLTPHPLLVPWSWKGRAIPLLALWAVLPVQSLSACTRVHFTLFHFSCKCSRLQDYETDAYICSSVQNNKTEPLGEETFTSCIPVVTAWNIYCLLSHALYFLSWSRSVTSVMLPGCSLSFTQEPAVIPCSDTVTSVHTLPTCSCKIHFSK